VVIDSLDVQRVVPLVERDHKGLVEYLARSLRRLAGAGVDFAALTANTPHLVFDELAAASPMPLVSIVETCAQEVKRLGLGRPLLLGTRFTMEGPFYPKVFTREGLELVRPGGDDVTWVHERYMGELLKGVFRDETRAGFVALVARLREAQRIDAVILGGTELPLLLQDAVVAGVPALDTTGLHVAAIVKRLLETESPRARD
jgi:aspartate racemase